MYIFIILRHVHEQIANVLVFQLLQLLDAGKLPVASAKACDIHLQLLPYISVANQSRSPDTIRFFHGSRLCFVQLQLRNTK